MHGAGALAAAQLEELKNRKLAKELSARDSMGMIFRFFFHVSFLQAVSASLGFHCSL